MFTGIVEQRGKVLALRRARKGAVLALGISAGLRRVLRVGESLAVDGVCLTVRARTKSGVECDLLEETLKRTHLGEIFEGADVNLERCLKVGDRFGGHFVTGHVDAVGKVLRMTQRGADRILTVGYPGRFAKYLVEKGSIALDGVSLTVVDAGARAFSVHLIPHTRKATTLGQCKVGDLLNVEFDIVAKYLCKWSRR